MDFLKITSILTRPSKEVNWFSTGETMSIYDDIDYISYMKRTWVFPGYIGHSTDIPGSKISLNVTLLDDYTRIWIRYWYDKKYYESYLEDAVIKKITRIENQYWQNNGLTYKETIENYPGKPTKNGFYYVGNHYVFSKHLNT